MKKCLYFSLFLISLICCLVFSSQAKSNTKSTAVSLTVDKAVSVKCAKDEYSVDYWVKFKPIEKGYYEFNVFGYPDETYLYLYNSKGVELDCEEWNSFFESTFITYNLKDSETYYLNLHSYNAYDEERTIQITAEKHKHSIYKEIDEYASFDYDNGLYYKLCSKCDYSKAVVVPYVKTIKLNTTSYIYDGKAKKPTLIIKDSEGNTLKEGVDYSISGKTSAKAIGKYSVNIKLKGYYSGSKNLTWKITPAKPVGLKITSRSSNSISLSWDKTSQATAYRVYYGDVDDYKEYSKNKTVTTNTATIKGLYFSSNYKIQVAAIKEINGVKIIGPKSSAIKCPTGPAATDLTVYSFDEGEISVDVSNDWPISGYKIYIASSKTGTYKCVKTIKTTKKYDNYCVFKGYKSGKTYYVKARAYYTWADQKVFGPYSSVQSIKVY